MSNSVRLFMNRCQKTRNPVFHRIRSYSFLSTILFWCQHFDNLHSMGVFCIYQ